MTTYRTIASAEWQPQAPVTSELVQALAQNHIAVAEGSAGAPRIASRTMFAQRTGASSGNSDFAGAAEYGGVWVDATASSADPSLSTITIAVSTDGSTFSTAVSIVAPPVSQSEKARFFLDFSTGTYQLVTQVSDGSSDGSTGTMSITGAITHVRFVITSVAGENAQIIAEFQGGQGVL